MNTDCVILAAGLSSRMVKNKMLLDIGGKTAIERCVGAFYESCSGIIVVTGRYHEDIKECLTPYPKIRFVYNKDYRQGMFCSVKTGIRHVTSERFFLTPGDYPLIKAGTVHRMINTAGSFVVPVYRGEQGHPVLLHKKLIPLILGSTSESLRDCLQRVSPEKREVSVDDKGVLTDMDTMEEYQAVSEEF